MTPTTKICPDCRLELPSHAFRPNKTTKSGLNPYCRDCNRTRTKAYRDETPEQKAARKEETRLRKLAEREAVLARASEREAASQAEISRRQAEGKVCPRCGDHKPSSEFHKNRTRFDGLSANCKVCHRSICLGWAERNADTLRERARAHRRRPEVREAKNARKRGAAVRAGTSRTEHYAHFVQWLDHTAGVFSRMFEAHDAHVKVFEHAARHAFESQFVDYDAHVTPWKRAQRLRARRSALETRSDIRRNLYSTVKGWVRKRLRHAIPNGFSWERALSYSQEDLAAHLEAQFLPGMGWHNRSDWHIDHILPIAAFDIQHWDTPEFRTCFALKNLRPLWATDNIRKGPRFHGMKSVYSSYHDETSSGPPSPARPRGGREAPWVGAAPGAARL